MPIMRKAITLIEMVVVLGIVSLLALVVVPAAISMLENQGSTLSLDVLERILIYSQSEAKAQGRYVGVRIDNQAIKNVISIPVYPQSLNPDDPINVTLVFKDLRDWPDINSRQGVVGVVDLAAVEFTERIMIIFSPQGRLVRKWVMMDYETEPYLSSHGLVVYDSQELQNAADPNQFLATQTPMYINAYTGQIIN